MCDFDCYHRGRYVLDRPKAFGSSRFMAPEEFKLDSLIDSRTTVYTLGRTARVLFADGSSDPSKWQISSELLEVAQRATRDNPEERYQRVAEFVEAWKSAEDVVY